MLGVGCHSQREGKDVCTWAAPSPDPTWRAAGALFSCSLHLRYMIRGSAPTTTSLAAGESEAKKRGTCRPPSFSHLHLSLLFLISLPTGPSSVAHHLRLTQTRLSLVAIGFSACL